MSFLASFFAWRRKARAAKDLDRAERRRAAAKAQMAYRKPRKREFKFLEGVLKESTEASLRASVELRAYVEGR